MALLHVCRTRLIPGIVAGKHVMGEAPLSDVDSLTTEDADNVSNEGVVVDTGGLGTAPNASEARALREDRRVPVSLTNAECAAILGDGQKCIRNDITWTEDEDHSPAWEFRAEDESPQGWPIFVKGRYNRSAGTLTYALILQTEGRIYGLDMGKDHHNPQCNQVGDKREHRWSEQYRDKEASVPDGVTAPVSEPVAVWRQFCTEARIRHDGIIKSPPLDQGDLEL